MSELLIPSYIRAAVLNQRMYPSGSPMVDRPISQVVQSLEPILQTSDRFTISCRQGKIFIKTREIPDAGLGPLLDEHGLQSVTFLRGITAAEIGQLVLLLSKKKLPDGKTSEWLEAQKVTHIQLDKVTVVEVMEGEIVMKKIDQIFASVRDFPGLMGSLRESYDMMDKLPDERSKQEVHDHMARKLSTLDPTVIRDLFENPLPKRMEDSGLRTAVLNNMTQEKVHDIFNEIGNWYRQVRDEATSDFEVVEQLNKFKSFLGKLLKAPASKKIPFSLYEEMLNKGLIDEIPPDIEKKTEEESLAAQVDDILAKPSEELLEPPLRDQLAPVLRKLCEVGLDDLAKRLMERIVENFAQQAALFRQVAVRVSRSFLEIFSVNRKERLWKQLADAVLNAADKERTGEVYRELAETLALLAVQRVLEGRSAEAESVLKLLSQHANDKNLLVPQRAGHAGKALSRVAEKTLDVFTEDLLSESREKSEAAKNLLSHLGDSAAPCYLRVVKKTRDVRKRRAAAGVLAYFGEPVKKLLAEELHPGNSSEVLLNILSVFDAFVSAEMIPRVEFLRNYPDSAVRRRFVFLLAKLPHPSARDLLAKFLTDNDEAVQIDAVRAAGELKNTPAVPRLVELLKSESTKLLEEVCIALGHIGDASAAGSLSEILEPKAGGLFKRKSAVEETVRVRAAWALGQIPSAESRESLSRCLKDHNLQIQTIARQALEARTV